MTSKLHKSMSNVDTDLREQIAALTSSEEIDKVVGIHKMEDTAVILAHLLPKVILNDMPIFREPGMCTHHTS